jgi:hypothetical protein
MSLALAAPAPAAATPFPPSISKEFSASSVLVSQNVTVYFQIKNLNSGSTLDNASFDDPLPSGLVVASPNQASTDCGGTITATPGSSDISFSGGTLPARGPDNTAGACNLSVELTATSQGTQNNTTGPVTSDESGPGNSSNTATVVVESSATVSAPTISKAFSASAVQVNHDLAVYFTIQNSNTDANATTLHNVSFSDPLPSGLVVASPNQASTDCGGTLTATPGSSSITFSGGTVAPPEPPDNAGGTCDIAVELEATSTGTINNTTGAVSSTETGPGNPSNTASLDVTPGPVVAAPTLAKAFGATSIQEGSSTSLTFTLTNPNASTTFANSGFTDPLPTGLTVANPNGVTGSCVSSAGGDLTATPGTGTIALSNTLLTANTSCTVSVDVVGTASGVPHNVTDPVTGSYDDGSGEPTSISGNRASADLTVIGPPTLHNAFAAKSIPVGGTTAATFSIHNPNPGTALTSIGFTDSLPAGLQVATPNGLTGSCAGGTITAGAGSQNISLSGASLGPAATCTFSVNVTGSTEGVQDNTTSTISSTEGGTGAAAPASIFVGRPPSMTEKFTPHAIDLGSTSTLAFRISNPNTSTLLPGLALADGLPRGLVVARPAHATTTCANGTLTAQPGQRTIRLAGGQLPAGQTCLVTVTTKGIHQGVERNTSGLVASKLTVPGNRATAFLTVIGPPAVTVSSPKKGAKYVLHQKVGARYGCKDDPNGPGIQSCIGTVANSGLIDTSTAGTHAFTVKARSRDGLTRSATVHYSVSSAKRDSTLLMPATLSDWLVVF